MSFTKGSNLFDCSKLHWIREVEHFTFWAYPGAVCSFIFTLWNVWTFIVYRHFTWVTLHCLMTIQDHVRNTKYQFLIQFFQMLYCQVLKALLQSLHSTTLSDALQFFLQSLHWNLARLTILPNLFNVKDWMYSPLWNSCDFQVSGHKPNTGQIIATTLIGLHIHISSFCTTYRAPVVQSVVSLTSSLRVISLTVLVDSIYNFLIFFAEKMWVAFALQKLLTFFQQNISAYLRITRYKF